MRNQKIRIRVLTFLLIGLLCLGFTACSLAVKDADSEAAKDQLIGGLVTRKPVEKTYAATAGVGEDAYLWGMEFEGIEGSYFYYTEEITEDGESVLSMHNCNARMTETEEGYSKIEVTAQFYYMPEKEEEVTTLYLNPLYKTADHEIYVMPGTSHSLGEGMNTENTSSSLTVSEEEKITFADETVVEKVTVRTDFEVVYEPQKVWISQMNEKDELIEKEEYLPDEIPHLIMAEPETEYVLLETEVLRPDGTTLIQREICDWDGETREGNDENNKEYIEEITHIYIYQAEENGFIKKNWHSIVWNREYK